MYTHEMNNKQVIFKYSQNTISNGNYLMTEVTAFFNGGFDIIYVKADYNNTIIQIQQFSEKKVVQSDELSDARNNYLNNTL